MQFAGKTVAVDFDGVLHSYDSGWTGPYPKDDPVEGALEFIGRLRDAGAHVVILSSRASTPAGYAGMLNWLRKHGFPTLEVTAEKPPAVAYVDDRAVTFRRNTAGHGNWDDCFAAVTQLVGAFGPFCSHLPR